MGQHDEVRDALHEACTSAIETLATNPGTATALQAERLHALTDGLAVHTALRPDLMRPEHIIAVMRRHLDALETSPTR